GGVAGAVQPAATTPGDKPGADLNGRDDDETVGLGKGNDLRERLFRAIASAVTISANNSMSPGVSSTGLVTILDEHGDANSCPTPLRSGGHAQGWRFDLTTTRRRRQEFADGCLGHDQKSSQIVGTTRAVVI